MKLIDEFLNLFFPPEKDGEPQPKWVRILLFAILVILIIGMLLIPQYA